MAFKSYPFSSSMISHRQLYLLSKDSVLNAASSETADSAMLGLKEKGYAKGSPELENPYAFEAIVSYELERSFKFLRDVAPDEKLIALYLLKYDYLNAKTLLKLNLLGHPFDESDITPFGTISFDVLKESINEQAYNRLPKEMGEAIRNLDKAFAVNDDATLIGLHMDKAYAKHVLREIEDEKNPLIHDYFEAYFDFTNIMIVLRLRATDYSSDILTDALLDGGRFFKADLVKAFEDKGESAYNYFYKYGYETVLKEAFEQFTGDEGLFALEKARDDYLLNILKKDRYDMFSASKAVGFLIAKEREAAAVRLLMVAILNHIGPEEIERRLKNLYH